MSVQALNAERQIWIYTQMLRIREFEERVSVPSPSIPRDPRAYPPRGRRGSIHRRSLCHFRDGDAALAPTAATDIHWRSAATRRP